MTSEVKVLIVMGSDSDLPVMREAQKALWEVGLGSEVRIISAHRTPERLVEGVREAEDRGVQVVICGAGGAAHLAGAVAAQTVLPVIGVPVANGPMNGVDALYATVQMPSGVPVATVAIDGARNAGILAAQIIATGDPGIRDALKEARAKIAARVEAKDLQIRKEETRKEETRKEETRGKEK